MLLMDFSVWIRKNGYQRMFKICNKSFRISTTKKGAADAMPYIKDLS